MKIIYKELELGYIQKIIDREDGNNTFTYPVCFQQGDTRTDYTNGAPILDAEGVETGEFEQIETVVDMWQEALDAGAVMLTDDDKATILTEQEKAVAQQYLTSTDWYVIRANEPDGKLIPADVLSARVEARAKL
tara:strand:- start:321 stop:722 length:402 start_codon:yes stop_codon:yes gene_type:complete